MAGQAAATWRCVATQRCVRDRRDHGGARAARPSFGASHPLGAFWAMMLTDPPKTEAGVTSPVSVQDQLRDVPLDLPL